LQSYAFRVLCAADLIFVVVGLCNMFS
jgi:hypothetical protein